MTFKIEVWPFGKRYSWILCWYNVYNIISLIDFNLIFTGNALKWGVLIILSDGISQWLFNHSQCVTTPWRESVKSRFKIIFHEHALVTTLDLRDLSLSSLHWTINIINVSFAITWNVGRIEDLNFVDICCFIMVLDLTDLCLSLFSTFSMLWPVWLESSNLTFQILF